MGIPFGVKKVDGDINGEEVLSLYGENFIFDPDVYVEGMAYTRFFGKEPENHDVLLLRYTPTKLKLICVPDHTITPLEFHLADVIMSNALPDTDSMLPIGKMALLPAVLRIKFNGGGYDVE
jgi:hypothetical protein